MSVTAVPLRPTARSTLVKLWIGIAALLVAAGLFAWYGTKAEAVVATSPEAFLASNGAREGVVTTPSGLQYEVIEQGQGGDRPAPTDVVLVNYAGTLVDGTEFDANEQTPLELDNVIPGWAEGLQLMQRGAEYRFWIPPSLAYGRAPPEGSPIPPGAVLVFDVTLIDFIDRQTLMQLQMQQMGGAEGAPGGGALPPGTLPPGTLPPGAAPIPGM